MLYTLFNHLSSIMGNICSGKHEKQQTTETHDNLNRNFTVYSFLFKATAIIDLIIGTYHCHQAETLLALVQHEYLDYCTQMRDYADDPELAIKNIMLQAKIVTTLPINKQCPYKKVQVCVLPSYSSYEEQSQLYLSQFENASKQIINNSSDIAIQLSHTSDSSNGLPNQTLMAIFLKVLSERVDQVNTRTQSSSRSSNKKIRLSVIVNDSKLLNLARYEIVKLENFELRKLLPQQKGIAC